MGSGAWYSEYREKSRNSVGGGSHGVLAYSVADPCDHQPTKCFARLSLPVAPASANILHFYDLEGRELMGLRTWEKGMFDQRVVSSESESTVGSHRVELESEGQIRNLGRDYEKQEMEIVLV